MCIVELFYKLFAFLLNKKIIPKQIKLRLPRIYSFIATIKSIEFALNSISLSVQLSDVFEKRQII
jgi:hypothetical protein